MLLAFLSRENCQGVKWRKCLSGVICKLKLKLCFHKVCSLQRHAVMPNIASYLSWVTGAAPFGVGHWKEPWPFSESEPSVSFTPGNLYPHFFLCEDKHFSLQSSQPPERGGNYWLHLKSKKLKTQGVGITWGLSGVCPGPSFCISHTRVVLVWLSVLESDRQPQPRFSVMREMSRQSSYVSSECFPISASQLRPPDSHEDSTQGEF